MHKYKTTLQCSKCIRYALFTCSGGHKKYLSLIHFYPPPREGTGFRQILSTKRSTSQFINKDIYLYI